MEAIVVPGSQANLRFALQMRAARMLNSTQLLDGIRWLVVVPKEVPEVALVIASCQSALVTVTLWHYKETLVC